MNGKTFEDLAVAGYRAYCNQAGGVTFDNKTLPHWSQIGENRQACWIAAAKEVVAQNSTPFFKQAAAAQPIDNYSVATSQPSECTTIYQFADQGSSVPAEPAAPAVFSSGGGGDYGGGGSSGSYDTSSSDSSSSSSDGGSSSSD